MDHIWRMLVAIFLLCCGIMSCLLAYFLELAVLFYVMLLLVLIGVGVGVIDIIDYYEERKQE